MFSKVLVMKLKSWIIQNRAKWIMFGLTGNMEFMTMLGLCWQSATSWSIPLILLKKSFEVSRSESWSVYSFLFTILVAGMEHFPLADWVSCGM